METFAQSSFYTQIFLHREVCAQKTFVHRRLHTHRNTHFFCKKKSLYSDALYKDAVAHINRGTYAFLHIENLFDRETFAQNNFYTCFPTQKIPRTEVLRTEGFTHNIFLHTDAFTHRCLYTDTNCTKKLVHTARVYTQPTFTSFHSPF